MTLTSIFRGEHPEPPPWLYARMAQGSLMRLIYRLFVDDLARALPPQTRLLDVGTGPGYLLGHLFQARPDLSLYGLDFSMDMIHRARPRQAALAPQASVRWVVADACLLPFPENVFNHAVATFSFHIWPCPETGLGELKRVLKPGGMAWVYELRREASIQDLQGFSRETKLPFPLVYLGFKIISRHHAVPAPEFAQALKQAVAAQGRLRPVHHIFWRAELEG
ncbi:MAG: class I SAM-dependent methyltransferase [Thermodesulfobacteriota bacterium]